MSGSTAIQFQSNLFLSNIFCVNISRAIRFLRKQKGWIQRQPADFANTSKSNISNLENGNQGYGEAISKCLVDALGCRVSSTFLLAEYLGRRQNNISKDLEEMPVELVFLQLPEPSQ